MLAHSGSRFGLVTDLFTSFTTVQLYGVCKEQNGRIGPGPDGTFSEDHRAVLEDIFKNLKITSDFENPS